MNHELAFLYLFSLMSFSSLAKLDPDKDYMFWKVVLSSIAFTVFSALGPWWLR